MNDDVLKMLRCVETRQPLANIEDALLATLNEAISLQRIKNRAGQTIDRPLSGGLINEDQTLLYPVFDGIPVLIADAAIEMATVEINP